MGCSRRRQTEIHELELNHFWRVSAAGVALLRSNPRHPQLADIRDEVDLLAEMTDWPRIREHCRRYLRLDDQVRQPLVRAETA